MGCGLGDTYEDLVRRPVLCFLAARSTGVPAREFGCVDATSEPAKCAVVGDGCSSSSSCVRFRAERVLRALAFTGVERPAAGSEARERATAAKTPASRLSASLSDAGASSLNCDDPRAKLTGTGTPALAVTVLADCRRRSRESLGSISPTRLGNTTPWVDALLFLPLAVGKKGVSRTAGMSYGSCVDAGGAVLGWRAVLFACSGAGVLGAGDTFLCFLDRRPILIGCGRGAVTGLLPSTTAGLARDRGGCASLSSSLASIPPGGDIDRALDRDDVLDTEAARALRFEGDSVLVLAPSVPSPWVAILDAGCACLPDLRFLRGGASSSASGSGSGSGCASNSGAGSGSGSGGCSGSGGGGGESEGGCSTSAWDFGAAAGD